MGRCPGLEQAFDTLADFEAVQAGTSTEELLDAVLNLQEAVGIDDDERVLIRERLSARGTATGFRGPVLMGLIIGLLAAE